jgi:tight adherence protein C
MPDFVNAAIAQLGVSTSTLAMIGVGIGTFIVVASLLGAQTRPDPVIGRLRAGRRFAARSGPIPGLLREAEAAPKGLMRTFVPEKDEERNAIRQQLNRAGFTGKNAVINYYLLRLVFGVLLPMLVLGILSFGHLLDLPPAIDERIASLGNLQTMQIVAAMILFGFYGPAWLVGGRVRARKVKLQQEFPKALDLLRVAVEAGMGLDAAMKRVAVEMQPISPEISEAFGNLERELHAGRDRSSAMYSMAQNMGIDEAMSFSNVILQSIQYGSSIADALQVYSDEMRAAREMRAQEKANKLPVQMSGVMAMLLLPALLMITLGPVVIRYIRFFAETG